ncbi:MAG: hypothetical protein QM669_01670 [Siphonobacter sp.]
MIQTFTQNDILRYAYEETTDEENQHIEEALIHDNELLLYYLDIIDLKAGMNKAILQPSDRVVNTIVNYSRQAKNQLTRYSV